MTVKIGIILPRKFISPDYFIPNTFTPDPTPKYSVSKIILNITPKFGDL
jgi:hypothetical protein